MKHIFIAYLLIFLDIDLNFGSVTIGLLPDFVGYIFMVKGLAQLAAESAYFEKVRTFAAGMAVYTGILYALDLLGISVELGWITVILGTIALVISLYISYVIILGIEEIEQRRAADLYSRRLRSTWNVMAVTQILSYAALFAPALALICIIVSCICSIAYLVAFYQTKKAYEGR